MESYPGGGANSLCKTVASCFESQRAVCEHEVAQETLSAFDIATLKLEESADQMITQHPADDFTRVRFMRHFRSQFLPWEVGVCRRNKGRKASGRKPSAQANY